MVYSVPLDRDLTQLGQFSPIIAAAPSIHLRRSTVPPVFFIRYELNNDIRERQNFDIYGKLRNTTVFPSGSLKYILRAPQGLVFGGSVILT